MSGTQIDCIADTSAIIHLAGHDLKTQAVLEETNFAITFVTVAELALGMRKAARKEAAFRQIDRALQGRQVFYPSESTPLVYADVCFDLEKNGLRIPSNDMWIAAFAIENGIPLVGRGAHFERIKQLQFVSF